LACGKKVPRVAWTVSRLCLHCSDESEHESSGPLSPIKFLRILFLWLTMSLHAPLVRIYERRTRFARVCRGQTPIREPACLKGNRSDDNADRASFRNSLGLLAVASRFFKPLDAQITIIYIWITL